MKINELFKPKNAKSRNLGNYSDGDTPFVSNSNINNGIVRYVDADIKAEIVKNVPCIAVNGFGFASVQMEAFIGAGNGGVHIIALLPIKKMGAIELAYFSAQINAASWRFSYGRRAILRRLLKVELQPFDLSKKQIEDFEKEFLANIKTSVNIVLK